jgi:gluconolactonase
MWERASRYPDPAVQSLDKSFEKYRQPLAAVELLYTGCRWAEGPVWFGDARCLLWSDIPNNRILRWDEETGATSAYRKPSNFANGNTRDRQGRLLTCEHGGRRVTRTEYDGSTTVLMDRFEGKRLNSPNDIVCKSDGSIWFTDPPFGISNDYEGDRAAPELPANVYRIDASTGNAAVVASDIKGPNGLAFSPDEKTLYLVEGRETPRRLLAFQVLGDGDQLSERRVFAVADDNGTLDGFRCDEDGNLWCGWGMGSVELDGVVVFSPGGERIGRIALPERCANLCFGGRRCNRLFMAASQSLYSLYVNTRGCS